MFEKVNPSHPDKVADRIAGAIVDSAYLKANYGKPECYNIDPKVAVEVLIGHGSCAIINETNTPLETKVINEIVKRIAGDVTVLYKEIPQDKHLAENQNGKIRCGDNGIFKGVPTNAEENILSSIARLIYKNHPTDGKYIIDKGYITVCQSNCTLEELGINVYKFNPLGYWTGGTDVDTGATNRKLGSDMGRAVTGGGLHGKDLSKADVSVNIYCHIKAQEFGRTYEVSCAIGDEYIGGIPYEHIVRVAKNYIYKIGGFEKLAEWGLI